jgi:hypothetical protein
MQKTKAPMGLLFRELVVPALNIKSTFIKDAPLAEPFPKNPGNRVGTYASVALKISNLILE